MQGVRNRFLWRLVGIALVLSISGCATGPGPGGSGNAALNQVNGDVCQELRTGMMWHTERNGVFPSFEEAEQYAADLRAGGYDDWRLPTQDELFNLHYIFFWKKNGSKKMQKVKRFITEVRTELKKVSWSTKDDLITSTIVVLGSVAFLALFIGICDFVISRIINILIR